jgi:predicted RNA-binding Zn ribbon-like protein
MVTEEGIAALDLLGGVLCLDFTNTANWEGDTPTEDWLTGAGALAAWGARVGVLTPHQVDMLLTSGAQTPAETTTVLERAHVLRGALHGLFMAVAAGETPAANDLAILNAALPDALGHLRLAATGEGFAWVWAADGEGLERVLWAVARSAADLLTSDQLGRVRMCPGDACGWLFLDTSRNRTRRWCDMATCGNLAKAQRFQARRKGTSPL